ncbi:MAG: barrel protein [Glaciihabitans sp.]|nr:barrel protein [Glaciihabitans sp.]
MIRVAGAPVSFGVFELAPEDGTVLPGPDLIAAALADAGYDGIDLGPVGFLGRGTELSDRLARHRLQLAGGWIDLPFHDDDAYTAAIPVLDDVLDAFIEAGGSTALPTGLPPALPTLAASSTPERMQHPGGGPGLSLDAAGWQRFAANVQRAAERVRNRGFEPTFHHHACTLVETPDEIETFLSLTDVGLTLDSGHLILGGGDPLTGLRDWAGRVNHIHIKDASVATLRRIVAAGGGMREVWAEGAFVALGKGDLDLDGFMSTLLAQEYSGWVVVEQDVIPRPGDPVDQAVTNQIINRKALSTWLP